MSGPILRCPPKPHTTPTRPSERCRWSPHHDHDMKIKRMPCMGDTLPVLHCIPSITWQDSASLLSHLDNACSTVLLCSAFRLMSVCQCRAALCSDSCPFVCAGLCQSRGALLADPGRAQQLESDLSHLAPKLSSLAVLLRAAVLPAMSLVNPEVASRLQVEHHLSCMMLRSGRMTAFVRLTLSPGA